MSNGNIDDEISAAERLLSWRPGIQSNSLPSKGGPKFFGTSDTVVEECKVNTQLDKYASVLHSEKVRKLSNLGSAEWMESLGVAKITKQGKFMQSMCHHNGEFFALFGEEALFLLDIGDLELTLNGVPLALQEAYSFILNNDKSCCSLQDYQVYSYLVKRGYIVQRYSLDDNCTGLVEKEKANKRKLPKDDEFEEGNSKQSKQDHKVVSKEILSPKSSRGWNMQSLPALSPYSLSHCTFILDAKFFPNLSNKSYTHLPKPDASLIPPNIDTHEYNIEEIWFQRIQKDYVNEKRNPQHSNMINLNDIARRAKTWTEYKKMVKIAKHKKTGKHFELLNKMHSGNIKPLLHPSQATSVDQVVKEIKLTNDASNKKFQNMQQHNQTCTIKYNVFKSDSLPFKKTNPGTPFCRIVVTTIQDEFLDTLTNITINRQSNSVPVKYGVVDYGQISFFSIDEGGVPTIINDP
ncbi:tRNA-splicing endonuclease subunit Sen54-like [Styela clava]